MKQLGPCPTALFIIGREYSTKNTLHHQSLYHCSKITTKKYDLGSKADVDLKELIAASCELPRSSQLRGGSLLEEGPGWCTRVCHMSPLLLISFPILFLPFTLLMLSFDEQKFLILMQSNLSFFPLVVSCFCIMLRNICLP